MEEPTEINCPFCGEIFTTFVDISGGSQNYIEDCQICCRPIEIKISMSRKTGRFRIDTSRE
jgi:hypothetical protein